MKFNAPNQAARQAGLTLVEGMVVLAILAVAAGLYLSTLSRGFTRSSRISCTGNLKQTGLAFRLWANDHQEKFPFASSAMEGSRPFVNSPQVFRHFQVMSNELVTPKILVCRADTARNPATDFTQLSNSNLSYFVGLDAREDAPNSILSGDRNITGGTLSNGFLRTLNANSEAGWTKEIHQNAGNVGLGDGSVQQMTTAALRQHVAGLTNLVIRLAVP